MKKNNRTAFVCFFPVVPINMGSAEVCFSFFKSWPSKNKSLFQMSPHKQSKNDYIITIDTKKDNSINKFFSLPKMMMSVYKYLKISKKPTLIIEGPSWIGYSFVIYKCLKFLLPNLLIIYHSHSIEYEIRKKKGNFLITFLTKFLEKKIFNTVNVATTVSKQESIKIKKLYGATPYIFPNGINTKRLKLTKKYLNKFKLPKKFILYCGSYLYEPNREAIDILINQIMPSLVNSYPNLKLVLTGGGITFKKSWLLNLGIIKKNKMIYALKKSTCTVVPIMSGYGSRIKIIEALMLGVVVVSTKQGIEGIDYNKKVKPPFVTNNIKEMTNITKKILLSNKLKKKSVKNKNKYIKLYSMEILTKKFYRYINNNKLTNK